jgi:nicotinamidase-related amidase
VEAGGAKVVLVQHDSTEVGSPLAPDTAGHSFKDVVDIEPDLLVRKTVHSAFFGEPDLAAWLEAEGQRGIVICGITTDHCCETTARVGSDLGYDVIFVSDATHAFDRTGPGGEVVPAEEVHRATDASLHGEFAEVVPTTALLGPSPGG